MFEKKDKVKEQVEELKSNLGMGFSSEGFSKKELRAVRAVLQEETTKRKSSEENNFYERVLDIVDNPDTNGEILSFGYCYGLPDEIGCNFSTTIMCVRPKEGNSNWEQIYYRREGEDFNGMGPGVVMKYDELKTSILTDEQISCIQSFTKNNDNATKALEMYIKDKGSSYDHTSSTTLGSPIRR